MWKFPRRLVIFILLSFPISISAQKCSIDKLVLESCYLQGLNDEYTLSVMAIGSNLTEGDTVRMIVDEKGSQIVTISSEQSAEVNNAARIKTINSTNRIIFNCKIKSGAHRLAFQIIRDGRNVFVSPQTKVIMPKPILLSASEQKNSVAFKEKLQGNRLDEFKLLEHLVKPKKEASHVTSCNCNLKRRDMISIFGQPDIQESSEHVGYYLNGRFNACHVLFVLDDQDNLINYTLNQCK
jgi:hypothetical protein